MNNLVLGSEGFVGKYFCEYLEGLGETVFRFDIEGNVTQDCRTAKIPLENIDRVYFLAWDVGGAKYLYKHDSQFRQLEWNLQILLNVMPQLRTNNTPLLFASSQLAQEYDTVYGSTKKVGEVWTKLLGGVCVRFWNVYGPLEKPSERSHVISDFVHQAHSSKQIKMLSTGQELRQFVHVDDVSRAMHMAMNQNLKGVYDITSFEWISVLDVAKFIGNEMGAEVLPGTETGRTPITPMVGKVPHWWPQIQLEEGIRQMTRMLPG
jgi:nucleoside-diphosphate-sugar epimerase